MDITINLTKKDITTTITLSLSFCDTNETMIAFIANELESLPSFLEWDQVPSWSTVGTHSPFLCKDNFSWLRQAIDTRFPAEVTATAAHQRAFIGLHQLRDDPNFTQYFDSTQFILPLQELLDPKPIQEEQARVCAVLKVRDHNIKLCRHSVPLHIEDTVTQFKRFVTRLPVANLAEMFSRIVVSKEMPFLMFHDTVQTFEYFKPPAAWLELDSSNIVFKIRHNADSEEYCTGVIVMDNGVCYCVLDTSEYYKSVNEAELLSMFRKAVQEPTLTLSEQSTFMTYDVVGVEFYSSYLADMIMHNLSSLFYVDEFARASKATNRLYVHLAQEEPTIKLSQRYTQKRFQFNMKTGTPYVSVRIKAEDVITVSRVRNLVSCLLGYYNAHVNEVREFYGRYTVPHDQHRLTEGPPAKKPLKLIAPDIFLPMYSRRCLNVPSIVSEAEVQGRPFLRFPVFGESEQRIYVCDHKKYIYPGLRVNELDNRKQFPYVPCCYSKDQRLNPNSKLNNYLQRVVTKPKIKHSQGAIINLPMQLRRYFTYLDAVNDYVVLSNPVGPLSFLTAVYYALYRKSTPQRVRRALREMPLEVCAQESFPATLDNGYSPILHIRLLETFFDVSIFLFDKHGPLLPTFERLYLKPVPTHKSVFIFVKASTHCLPIVQTGAPNAFFPSGPLVTEMYHHVERLAPHKFTDQSVVEYFSNYNVAGQVLNSDRHCILFVCDIQGQHIPIATEPQIPFSAPIISAIRRLTNPTAIRVLFPTTRYIATNGMVKEIIVPFATQARVLTWFPENIMTTQDRADWPERYSNVDSAENLLVYDVMSTMKASKDLLRLLEAMMLTGGLQMTQENITQWIQTNHQLLPPLPPHIMALLVQKLSFLIHLKQKNGVPGATFDPMQVEPKPNTVTTFFKSVLNTQVIVTKYKPDLMHMAVGDKILINGHVYTRIQETSASLNKLPEGIYHPGTKQLYDLSGTVIHPSTFKAYVNGELWSFTQLDMIPNC